MLSQYLPYLPLRLSTLTRYLAESLAEIKHDVAGTPIARILSRTPDQRVTAIGEQSDTGSMVSLVFLEVGQDPRLLLTSNKMSNSLPGK